MIQTQSYDDYQEGFALQNIIFNSISVSRIIHIHILKHAHICIYALTYIIVYVSMFQS